jgi:hypothetical protein
MDGEENLDWDPGTVLPATAATEAGVGKDAKRMWTENLTQSFLPQLPLM